jgi:hypothetical protein
MARSTMIAPVALMAPETSLDASAGSTALTWIVVRLCAASG